MVKESSKQKKRKFVLHALLPMALVLWSIWPILVILLTALITSTFNIDMSGLAAGDAPEHAVVWGVNLGPLISFAGLGAPLALIITVPSGGFALAIYGIVFLIKATGGKNAT
ncbi:MAG: hypothetical protein MK108_03340 [Mariniblastus sp.]|nr:hypothetical protein [Mariniblastus sp.]